MNVAHVIGIDPGLVDTGVVSMLFKPNLKTLRVEHAVIPGTDAEAVSMWIADVGRTYTSFIFIEKYKPRLTLDSDIRMVQAEQDLKRALPDAQLLQNMGIKRVIPQTLMEVFGVWSWPTVTHHQDLRSAARIALLGMVKDPRLNAVTADVVRDHLEGRPWTVSNA
ncbi:MAG: hypothetical protein ACOYB3_02100 [Azonexus sp.]